MKNYIHTIMACYLFINLSLQTNDKVIQNYSYFNPNQIATKYNTPIHEKSDLYQDKIAAEFITLLNKTIELHTTIASRNMATDTEKEKNLWEETINFFKEFNHNPINQKLTRTRPTIENLQKLALEKNKIHELFNLLLNEYLTNFGQMYEKRSTIFYGRSQYFILASQADKNKAITPLLYKNLLQTLQIAEKQPDLAKAIIILPVVLENNLVVEKQFTLNAIIKAMQELTPSSEMYTTAKNIALGAAVIGATAAAAYGIYTNYNPVQNTLLPPSTGRPLQIDISENTKQVIDNKQVNFPLTAQAENIKSKNSMVTNSKENKPLSHLEKSQAQDEFFATLQPRSLIDIAADNVRSYDEKQQTLKNKKFNEKIEQLAQHGNQDAIDIINNINNDLQLNTDQIVFINQIEQSIPDLGNFDIFDTTKHHDPIFKNDRIPFPIAQAESQLTAYPKVAGNIAVIGSKAIANEIPAIAMHAVNNLANLPNDIAHRAQVALVNYSDTKNNTNKLDRTKYARYIPGKGAQAQIEKINKISQSESSLQDQNTTIMSQEQPYTITSNVVAVNPFDIENSYIQADAGDMSLATTAASLMDVSLVKDLGITLPKKIIEKGLSKNSSLTPTQSFNPKTMHNVE